MTEDIKAGVLKKLSPYNPVFEDQGRGFHRFQLTGLTPEVAEKLSEICGPMAPLPAGLVHVGSFKTYKTILQVIASFLATHTYAAFQEDEENAIDISGDIDIDGEDWGTTTQFFRFVEKNPTLMGDTKAVESLINTAIENQVEERRERAQAIIDQENWETEEIMELFGETYSLSSILENNMGGRPLVPTATPSTSPYTVNFGTTAEHPKGSAGLFFPYVQGMNSQDYTTLPSIFIEHFIRVLGNDAHSILKAVKTFKSDVSSICGTATGIMLTHLFTGIDLALKTQARLYVIMEGYEYLGFSLLGNSFGINLPNRIYYPRSWASIEKKLATIRSHSIALVDLAGLLSGICLTKATEDAIEVNETVHAIDIDSSQKLLQVMLKRTISAKQMREEFMPIYKSVRYQERLRHLGTGFFIETIKCMADPTSESAQKILQHSGIHIPIEYSALCTPQALLLATHGPEVFSPISPKGSNLNVGQKKAHKIDVYERSGKGPAKKTQQEVFAVPPEQVLEKIILGRRPLVQCIKDWADFTKTGNLFFDPRERAQGSRGLVLSGGVKTEMQNLLAELSKGRAPEKQKKRARDDEDEDAILAKKAKLNDFFGF